MWLEDMGIDATHLIRDRDAKFSKSFDLLMKSSGIKVIKLPARSPNLNAFAESWVGTIKRECLNYFFCFSLKHVDHIVQSYACFYNELRPHQSKGNRVLRFKDDKLRFPEPVGCPLGKVQMQVIPWWGIEALLQPSCVTSIHLSKIEVLSYVV